MSNPNDTDSFFQEVNERLREDQVLSGLKRWGPYILAVIIAVVVGVLAWQGWISYSRSQAQAESTQLAAAQKLAREGDLPGALAEFDRLSHRGPQVYRAMALMERAGVLQAQGDLAGAITAFDQAAAMTRDPALRDSARIRAAYLVADTQDFQAVQTRLQPLIEGEGQIAAMAKELLAIEAWEAGNTQLARTTYQELTLAFDVPESVRQRAQLGLAVLGPDPNPPAAPASGAAPATNQPAAPPSSGATAPRDGESKQ